MFKRLTALALVFVLALGFVPAANAFGRDPIAPVDQCCSTLRVDPLNPAYTRPAYDGKLIKITPQRVEDTFAYLEEHYEKNHPEQALMVYTGTAEDRQVIKTLAETITAGCKTAKQKADAIDAWMDRNIYYDVQTSAYASDTFYRREGNCLSYANLMMFMLRSLGIPAVIGDGWRGDMKTSTVDLFNYEGHAWIFVLLNGEWVLYDPLWLNGGTTDRDYMAENIYFDTVEFVVPVADGNNLPPVAYDRSYAYCTDGKYYLYSDRNPLGVGVSSQFVNNQAYIFVSNQDEGEIGDGRYYLDEGRDKSTMSQGDLYRDSWVSYGDYKAGNAMLVSYAFPNGMMPDGYTKEFDGKLWYMSYDSAVPILANEKDYWIQDGLVTVKPGFSGQLLGLCWQDGVINREDHYLTYTSLNPAVATIDDNGKVTCHAEGYGEFEVRLMRQERDGSSTLMGNDVLQFFVSNENRIPDYSDHAPCDHRYKLSGQFGATCTAWGYELHICTLCGARAEIATAKPLGHNHIQETLTPATCVSTGTSEYRCTRCGDRYPGGALPIDPLGHDWDGETCKLCGVTRLTPFDDVAPGQFYEVPVAWAVENGVTNGMTNIDFGTNISCNRAQVVTFLWRAAGEPKPKNSHNPFVDVQKGSFYEKAVLWAVEQGITNGMDATHFGPNEFCNRATVVTLLWRAKNKPAATGNIPFTDVPADSWYASPVLWAVNTGVTNGLGDGTFGINGICNRAQVVTFLYRAFTD